MSPRKQMAKAPSNGKKKGKKIIKQEPPFPLYAGGSSTRSFDEGWASVVALLKGRKNIAVLTGAGISVSCGIPDFRSKDKGLYATLDAEVRTGRGLLAWCDGCDAGFPRHHIANNLSLLPIVL